MTIRFRNPYLLATLLAFGSPLLFINNCGKKSSGDEGAGKRLAGTAKGFNSPPELAGAKEMYSKMAEPGAPITLGYAVDLDNQKGISNRCLNGTTETIPMQEGFLNLDSAMTADEIESSLNTNASGKASFFGFGGSASGYFNQKIRESRYDLSFIAQAAFKHHSEVFVPTGRTETFKDANPEEWNESCGTGYVAAQDYGSMIFVKFSLKLEKKEEERNWGGSAGGNYGNFGSFASLRASISANGSKKESRQKGTLSVFVYQKGGKPEELGKILKADGKNGVIENFALCDVFEYDKCLVGLRAIENYLADVFPKQIADKENGGGAVLNHYPFKYPKGMGSGVNPALAPFVKDARAGLAKLHEDEMQELLLIKAKGRKDDEEAQKIASQMQDNLTRIRGEGKSCFNTESYAKCADLFAEMRTKCAETSVPDSVLASGASGQGTKPVNTGE